MRTAPVHHGETSGSNLIPCPRGCEFRGRPGQGHARTSLRIKTRNDEESDHHYTPKRQAVRIGLSTMSMKRWELLQYDTRNKGIFVCHAPQDPSRCLQTRDQWLRAVWVCGTNSKTTTDAPAIGVRWAASCTWPGAQTYTLSRDAVGISG